MNITKPRVNQRKIIVVYIMFKSVLTRFFFWGNLWVLVCTRTLGTALPRCFRWKNEQQLPKSCAFDHRFLLTGIGSRTPPSYIIITKRKKAPLFSGTLSIPSGAVNANASSSVVLPQACPPQIGNNKLQTTGCLKNLAGQGGCLLLWYGPWIEMMNRVRWSSYCQISDILVIVQVLKRFCLFMQVHIYRLRRNELCFNSIRFRNFIPRLNVPQRGKVRWCHEYIWFLT